ncbi:MAG: hypothetical protein IPK26_05165 [Planctomycetes bacterium]|nr:hypothetical protein [Planctomycetota bacterium]
MTTQRNMADIKLGRCMGARAAVLGAALLLAACGGSGGSTTTPVGTTAHPELLAVEFGRLVDVYGLRQTDQGLQFDLFQRDVMIGSDIQDERDTGENKADSEILYDFLSADPDSLQPRLFIPRAFGSREFQDAFDALDDELRTVTAMAFGQAGPGRPYSVVPRNAAIRLRFSARLGIDDGFFYTRGTGGNITGLRNSEAVQLLQIAGDPTQAGAFEPLAARVVVRDTAVILDPVLLGTEGLQLQTRNNASGLPEAPDQVGANIRVAIALEGPLAIPGLRGDAAEALTGLNNAGRRAIIRDFRSGATADTSADFSRGFVRDPLPARVVGEIVMFLERVTPVNQFTQEVVIYKNGIVHEIDRGDVLRFVADNSGVPFGAAEVVSDPDDDRGNAGAQHVRVRIRLIPGLDQIDPQRLGPPTIQSELEPWLVRNAPRAVLVAEFAAGGRTDPVSGNVIGDDPRYFITFSPTPLPNLDGSMGAPNENVSPFAGAVVRFTKPVDMTTVKWADSFFFATRNVLDAAAIEEFVLNRPNGTATPGMDRSAFDADKFRTPHLVAASVFDEDGSQTALRLQPNAGFYLDDTMRNPPAGVDMRYYLHMIAGNGGIRDLSGNAVDLQADVVDRAENVVIPFSIDTRTNGQRPFFENNLAVSIVRRYAGRDEDEQPSYYMPDEVQPGTGTARATAYGLEDVFGAAVQVDGRLLARPTSRVRQIADNLNQAPVASQATNLRWCAQTVGGEEQIASNTSTTPFGQPLQNPLNPYGCRLQTVWREIDLSLSRVDPFDFNLDVEQMFWAPFAGGTITFDEFDRITLFLGHSERRPEPCVGNFSALATFPDSGLLPVFNDNYAHNLRANGATGERDSQPNPHAAYVDAPLTVDPQSTVYEPNRVNRFLPLPEFRQPYFVYRDETVIEQGCVSNVGSDIAANVAYNPWIISPWGNGNGRRAVQAGQAITFVNGFWNNCVNYFLNARSQTDRFTQGLTGNIALPLLGDFWTYCDSADLPTGNGYVALGSNGWQVSITVQSGPQPNFRVLSAGRAALPSGAPPICVSAGSTAWNSSTGGYTPTGAATARGDNTFYWIMIDFLKRQSVATAGFVDLFNPHRVPEGFADTRLGPFYLANGTPNLPQDVLPAFSYLFDPPLSQLPGGTGIVPQFRGAGRVDTTPWYWQEWVNLGNLYPAGFDPQLRPDATNFPLDPYKACDAHIRKYDDRPVATGGVNRNWWTYLYNRTVTSYTEDPNNLMDPAFTLRSVGPNESFTPRDVRYLNWRFLMTNNTEANPPVAPSIETFALSYRFQRVR